MPRDDWAKARAKDAARKRLSPFARYEQAKSRKAKHARHIAQLVTINPGTPVQVRKFGQPHWRNHIVRHRVRAPVSRRYGDTIYMHFLGWEIQVTRP